MKRSIVALTLCVPSAIRLVGTAHRVCLLLFMGSSLSADEIRFNEHVRPILAEHCLHCHGPDDRHREGELRLDTEDAAKASVIVARSPPRP